MKRSFFELNPEVLKPLFVFGNAAIMLVFFYLHSLAAFYLPKLVFSATHSMVAVVLVGIMILTTYCIIGVNCFMIAITVILKKDSREKILLFIEKGGLRRIAGWPTMKFYAYTLTE